MNIVCVVQARFASTRLPGKVMYPLYGTTMLGFLLRRLITIKNSNLELCLATTCNPEDNVLAAWAESLDVPVIRGDEQNVLQRYIMCLDHFQAESCIRVTADNPLTSKTMISLVQAALNQGYDYVDGFSGCPIGLGVDGFSEQVLRHLNGIALSPEEREHINKRIIDFPEYFSRYQVNPPLYLQRKDISLTVDTMQQYTLLRERVRSLKVSIESITALHVLP